MRRILIVLCCLAMFSSTMLAESPFAVRGYYMTFMRMPLWGLAEWKEALKCIEEDGGNTVLLWMGGGFRSKKFPITWKYNVEHRNVREDFGRELIEEAHRRGIRVVLGFTPFGYDGVNQYALEHPELKAKKADGSPVDAFGIHCWGWSLCPSQAVAQRFMIDYVREMVFEFYPGADGIMIESSDYNVCRCADCGPKYYEKEFAFVRQISDEVWARNPKALIAVYPHYFSGKRVNAGSEIEAEGAKFDLDRRWTLCFNPHSAHLDQEMVRRAGSTMFWNDAPSVGTPEGIRDGARRAKEFGMTGFVPSLEPFSYVMPREEFGAGGAGERIVQLGFDWMPPEKMSLSELPARVQRLAYREFTKKPDLEMAEFRKIVGREFIDAADAREKEIESLTDDLLFLQSCVNHQRVWSWASPLVDPRQYERKARDAKWREANRVEYAQRLERLREIAKASERLRGKSNATVSEMAQIADFIVKRWGEKTP
jgi:hypothetical protein